MRESSSNTGLVRNLVLGVTLSASMHGAVLIWSQIHASQAGLVTNHVQDPPPETNPLKLGIDRSSNATINWIGFESPTEHAAAESTVEQAAVTPVIGTTQVASEDQPSPPAEAPTPSEQAPPDQTQRAEASETPAPDRAQNDQPASSSSAITIPMDIFEPVATAPVVETDAVLQAAPGPDVKSSETRGPAEPKLADATPPKSADAKPSESPRETNAKPSDPAGTQGIKDTREADASSTIPNLKWSPGKPIAGEGLDIATVRPQWSITVKAIARPRNPVVQIHFGADGIVRRAEFIKVDGEVQNTGHTHVDGPLLDAIYRWTAKGKAIDDLKKDETMTVEIQLLLRG